MGNYLIISTDCLPLLHLCLALLYLLCLPYRFWRDPRLGYGYDRCGLRIHHRMFIIYGWWMNCWPMSRSVSPLPICVCLFKRDFTRGIVRSTVLSPRVVFIPWCLVHCKWGDNLRSASWLFFAQYPSCLHVYPRFHFLSWHYLGRPLHRWYHIRFLCKYPNSCKHTLYSKTNSWCSW